MTRTPSHFRSRTALSPTRHALGVDSAGATYTEYLVVAACVAVPAIAVYASSMDAFGEALIERALSLLGVPLP
jgi:hypothetical protein